MNEKLDLKSKFLPRDCNAANPFIFAIKLENNNKCVVRSFSVEKINLLSTLTVRANVKFWNGLPSDIIFRNDCCRCCPNLLVSFDYFTQNKFLRFFDYLLRY